MRMAFVVSVVMMLGFIAGASIWLRQTVERPAIAIQAAHDIPENGLPVYAQFVVTQTLELPHPASIVALEVPIYFPSEQQLRVELKAAGKLIESWPVLAVDEAETTILRLPLAQPRYLTRDLEVSFHGEHIRAAEKNEAPRIFIESADDHYPAGNYRIVQNNKQGDVALTLIEVVSRGQIWRERLRAESVTTLSKVLVLAAVGILLAGLPYVFTPLPPQN